MEKGLVHVPGSLHETPVSKLWRDVYVAAFQMNKHQVECKAYADIAVKNYKEATTEVD